MNNRIGAVLVSSGQYRDRTYVKFYYEDGRIRMYEDVTFSSLWRIAGVLERMDWHVMVQPFTASVDVFYHNPS